MSSSHRHRTSRVQSVPTPQYHLIASLYAVQPGILCIKYKSRLAVLIKAQKKIMEEKKFLVVH